MAEKVDAQAGVLMVKSNLVRGGKYSCKVTEIQILTRSDFKE